MTPSLSFILDIRHSILRRRHNGEFTMSEVPLFKKKKKNPKGPEVCDTVAHSSHQAELPFRRPIPPQSHWNQCITRPKEKPPNSVKHISFPREQKQVKNGDTHTHTQKNPGTKLAVRCTDLIIIIIIKKSTKKEQPKKKNWSEGKVSWLCLSAGNIRFLFF